MKKQIRFTPETWEQLLEQKKALKKPINEIVSEKIVQTLDTNRNRVFGKYIIDIPMSSAKILDLSDEADHLLKKAQHTTTAVRTAQWKSPFVSVEEIILQII